VEHECVSECSMTTPLFSASHNPPKLMIPSLAMAEMTTLIATIYRNYRTTLHESFEGTSPGITSRFEVFRDDTLDRIQVSQEQKVISNF